MKPKLKKFKNNWDMFIKNKEKHKHKMCTLEETIFLILSKKINNSKIYLENEFKENGYNVEITVNIRFLNKPISL
jgi:hypothetical protein